MSKKKPKKPVDVPTDPGTAEFKEPGAADPPPLQAAVDAISALAPQMQKEGVHLATMQDEPGPVKPSEEAEAVYEVLAVATPDGYFVPDRGFYDRALKAFAAAIARRFPGLTRTPAAEEPLAFAGGSNVLLEFNGDSWTAMCNAASGAGYVRQTRAEGADLKTPQAALAAVLGLVRERAKGVSQ